MKIAEAYRPKFAASAALPNYTDVTQKVFASLQRARKCLIRPVDGSTFGFTRQVLGMLGGMGIGMARCVEETCQFK